MAAESHRLTVEILICLVAMYWLARIPATIKVIRPAIEAAPWALMHLTIIIRILTHTIRSVNTTT